MSSIRFLGAAGTVTDPPPARPSRPRRPPAAPVEGGVSRPGLLHSRDPRPRPPAPPRLGAAAGRRGALRQQARLLQARSASAASLRRGGGGPIAPAPRHPPPLRGRAAPAGAR